MYTYTVKGQTLEVVKVFTDDGKIYWYYTVNGAGADDWYTKKRIAKSAGIEWINENY